MPRSSCESFVSSLEGLEVPYEQTTSAEFASTLAAHVEKPAVGVSLDGTNASLDDTDISADPTPAALKTAQTGITPAAYAIADYGSVVIPSTPNSCELVSLFVDRHIAVIDEANVLPSMDAAFEEFGERFRADATSEIIATGPSATADMGDLVRGAHGPSEIHVVVVEETDE